MLWSDCWRRLKVAFAHVPLRRKASVYPVFLYRDTGQGDIEQGIRLANGHFVFDGRSYRLSARTAWEEPWPADVRRWVYSFVWLRDLQALGSNEARLTARTLIASWIAHTPHDPIAQEAPVLGQRLASWLGQYEFCLLTAKDVFQKQVMEVIRRDGRVLAALLPLSPHGWRGLLALRGLLAAFMAVPDQEGFFLRYQRYLPYELERLIGADGVVADRSPEAQFQAVQELSSMIAMFNALQLPVPPLMSTTLARICPVLRAFCHADGRLAVFNGATERTEDDLARVLERAERYKVIASSVSMGGFMRLTLGQSLLFVDAAPPPSLGHDRDAHAGTLSFEFSHHHHRLLVNCGASLGGAWKQAMRESAAHNVLVADNLSSSDFGRDGHVSRRPSQVECQHRSNDEAHWLDLSHNGYYPSLGATWSRQLYLGQNGEDLRGCDIIEGERDVRFIVRFHVHPDVRVVQEECDIILHAGEEIWRFCQAGGMLSVSDDVYLGRGHPEPSRQIVIASRGGRDVQTEGKPHKRQQKVSWMLERVPA